ncbi:hypothetical protein JKP88DRAFT_248453 [Tribonema minus]|uniref:Ankyrin repeat domain containing protein n=1 Tax=Tribonema minus TaxID=303371 RepID=A0A835YVQ7_9STRA|nr:hypothetical protein JKP88DRAFT_248453 [Tribonema minus]
MNGPDETLAGNESLTWSGGAWLVLCELIGPNRYLHTALVCREWRETYASLYPKATAITAADLSVDQLLWARAHGCCWGKHLTLLAASAGDLRLLRYLLANACPWDAYQAFGAAVSAGRAHVLPCIHGMMRHLNIELWPKSTAAEWRCAHHLDCERVCVGAARYGHVEVLEWCRRNGAGVFAYDGGAAASAARAGQVEVLRWLRAHGCWSRRVVQAALNLAMRDNQVEAVRWLCANRTEPQRDTEDPSCTSTI